MPESASVLEITWTTIAIVAIGFTAWILDDNVRNFAAIRRAVRLGRATAWGPRYWVAFASLVSSAAMFLVWLGFAIIGVVAMSVAATVDAARAALASYISGWVLVITTLILAGIQAWQVFARTKIRPLTALPHNATANDIAAAADQTQLAANMVADLRPLEGDALPQKEA